MSHTSSKFCCEECKHGRECSGKKKKPCPKDGRFAFDKYKIDWGVVNKLCDNIALSTLSDTCSKKSSFAYTFDSDADREVYLPKIVEAEKEKDCCKGNNPSREAIVGRMFVITNISDFTLTFKNYLQTTTVATLAPGDVAFLTAKKIDGQVWVSRVLTA